VSTTFYIVEHVKWVAAFSATVLERGGVVTVTEGSALSEEKGKTCGERFGVIEFGL
jgi:hypothetical protein